MKGNENEREKAVKEEQEEEEERNMMSGLFFNIMKNYSDSVIPPLSELSPLVSGTTINKNGSSSIKRRRDPEINQKEREKREKMTQMFSVLQSIVPNLYHKKVTREKIVTNTIKYIQRLEEERERLEKELNKPPAARPPTLSHRANLNILVTVAVSDGIAFFEIQSPFRRYCLVTDIVGVFAKHNAEVLAANVAVNKQNLKLAVTAIMVGFNGGHDTAEKIKRDILLL